MYFVSAAKEEKAGQIVEGSALAFAHIGGEAVDLVHELVDFALEKRDGFVGCSFCFVY